MSKHYEMCTTCGLTKSPIPPNIYVIRTDQAARLFAAHTVLQCTREQVKPILMCDDCFNEMQPLTAPAPTKT